MRPPAGAGAGAARSASTPLGGPPTNYAQLTAACARPPAPRVGGPEPRARAAQSAPPSSETLFGGPSDAAGNQLQGCTALRFINMILTISFRHTYFNE